MKLQQLVNKCISVNYLEKHFLFSVMQNSQKMQYLGS